MDRNRGTAYLVSWNSDSVFRHDIHDDLPIDDVIWQKNETAFSCYGE